MPILLITPLLVNWGWSWIKDHTSDSWTCLALFKLRMISPYFHYRTLWACPKSSWYLMIVFLMHDPPLKTFQSANLNNSFSSTPFHASSYLSLLPPTSYSIMYRSLLQLFKGKKTSCRSLPSKNTRRQSCFVPKLVRAVDSRVWLLRNCALQLVRAHHNRFR